MAQLARRNGAVLPTTLIAIYGRILASASRDTTARLWNLDNGQPIIFPIEHADTVSCVSFSADGRLVATGCHDHNAYVWTIDSLRAVHSFSLLQKDLNDGDKPLPDADAAHHPVQQVEDVSSEWLQTPRGRDWLRTQVGRDWLRTERGRDILQTQSMRDWLKTQGGKDWLQTPGGQD
ncbi:hypothetical protein BDR04DRAFT_1164182 [Suillus decipiens]|nr:hypothetical protein BDR04DRAFT_1164182 [Suillus decipiens]